MSSKNKFFDVKKKVASLLGKNIPLKEKEILNLLEIPPDEKLGDYSFPCFSLSKKLKQNPNIIAEQLASRIKAGKEIEKIKVAGGYINFFVNKKQIAEQIIKIRDSYGQRKEKKKIMIEFSQANTHKAFHIGHIRGTSLGESIARILEFSGNKVIRANYQGDTGMHVAKWLWCFLKYHSKEILKDDESWIAAVYVDSLKRLEKDKTGRLQGEVEEINRKLEKREDKKLNELWKKTRNLSLKSFENIYRDLSTKFNVYYFEKNMEKPGKQIAENLLNKKIAKESEKAIIMDLEKYNLGIWVLLRKDGTVLYSAKDTALAKKKFEDYKLDKSIYVVGSAQKLHFQQLLKTLELLKFKKIKNIDVVLFHEVRLPQGKMSSRTGENILYSHFKPEIIDYAKQEIKKRNPKITKSQLEKRALAISISAVKFAMLKQDPNKSIIFVKEEALNFEGFSGPYLQYSYARASSILKKTKKAKKTIKIPELNNQEIKLIKKISEFPDIVEKASKQLNPALIANYSFSLAQSFNEFYHSSRVVNSKEEAFRLRLVEVFRTIMKSSLSLLGIDVIEEM